MRTRRHGRSARRFPVAVLVAATTMLTFAGCDSLLEVEAVSRVEAEKLDDPGFAGLLVTSMVGDFNCALASYITTTSQVADEMISVHIYSAEALDYDRRSVNPARQQYATNECGQYGAIYQPLSTAIWQSINVLEKFEQFGDAEIPDRALLEQTTQAYGAYARLLLGEGFCTAAINLGPELSSPEVFELAEALFTDAIAGPDDDLRNMARVGRARARLNLGDHAGALEDARAVPVGYVRNALYSSASSRSQNEVYNRNNQVHGMSVEHRNPTFAGVADPRVASVNTGDLGSNGFDTVWVQLKYESLDAPIPIARYEEAQLIIAEIEGGQTAVDIINRLHDAAGIPHFAGGSEEEIRQHVIQERARELYLEGHRFWDIRRFEIPFDPPVGAQYPTGSFYGDTRCFPLPDLERDNNPNLRGG